MSEFKLFAGFLIIFILLVIILNPEMAAVDNVFQTVSALGTCGFNSVETPNMPVPLLLLLVIAMNFGGNATSTTGGLKTRRILWIFKGIIKSVRDAGKEEENKSSVFFNGKELKDEEASEQIMNASLIFMLWIGALTIGSFLIVLTEGERYSYYQIFFDVSSALNNVGLSAGVNGNEMSAFSKGVFIVLMWIGRLEIFACIILIYTFLKSRIPFRH